MAHVKKFNDFNKINEKRVVKVGPVEERILEYAEKYGYDALGFVICDIIKNDGYTFPQNLPDYLWEYDDDILNTCNF